MHVHDGHRGAIGAEVDVVGEEPWLFRLDEVDEVFEARLQLVECSLANLRNIDVHNRGGHIPPVTRIDVLGLGANALQESVPSIGRHFKRDRSSRRGGPGSPWLAG